jgi:hypothetical protein
MNRRASYADIGIVVAVIIFTSILLINKDPTERATATIGEYQHDLLDSYIVAENSRFYIETSYAYAVQRALYDSGYCSDLDQKDAFLDSVEGYLARDYTQNLPETVGELSISKPFEQKSWITDRIVYKIEGLNLNLGTRILTVNSNSIYVTNSNPNFEVNTSVAIDLSYDIDYFCESETLESVESRLSDSDDSVTDTEEVVVSEG